MNAVQPDMMLMTRKANDAIMAMDGTTAIKDAITGTALTMAGTPTFATLLGVQAPKISATEYATCTIPTATIGMTAGMPLSIAIVCQSTWQGDDGVGHYLLNTREASGTNDMRLFKHTDNKLYWRIYDATPAERNCATAALTAATWAANTPHIIVVTRSVAGVLSAYLDGVVFATLNGGAGTGLEAVVGANVCLGTTAGSGSLLNGSILTAIYGRVLSAGEITALSAMSNWGALL
jgi:hypothetical protein